MIGWILWHVKPWAKDALVLLIIVDSCAVICILF